MESCTFEQRFSHPDFTAVDEEKAVLINTAELEIKIDKSPFLISIFDRENRLIAKKALPWEWAAMVMPICKWISLLMSTFLVWLRDSVR